jgi:hypothetical protein
MLQEIYPVDTPEITAIDKRPKARYHLKKAGADAIHIVKDYLTFSPRKGRRSRWDLALGNPPYSSAMPFIKKTLELAPIVVFLLRLGFLCSQGRSSWLRANTPTIIPLSRRPSFTGNGTDRYDYAWFVWGDPRGPRIVMRKVDDVSES